MKPQDAEEAAELVRQHAALLKLEESSRYANGKQKFKMTFGDGCRGVNSLVIELTKLEFTATLELRRAVVEDRLRAIGVDV